MYSDPVFFEPQKPKYESVEDSALNIEQSQDTCVQIRKHRVDNDTLIKGKKEEKKKTGPVKDAVRGQKAEGFISIGMTE